jgi:voltage-gated potassium channel
MGRSAICARNRPAYALGETMRRRGFGYVAALTPVVVSGAAGMYAFERGTPGQSGFDTYGGALWWTAVIITTLGSQYWPVTTAGRIRCLLLSIYAFTAFGYIATVLASHFVGRDALRKPDSSSRQDLQALQAEIAALREELRTRQTQTYERRSEVDHLHPN